MLTQLKYYGQKSNHFYAKKNLKRVFLVLVLQLLTLMPCSNKLKSESVQGLSSRDSDLTSNNVCPSKLVSNHYSLASL